MKHTSSGQASPDIAPEGVFHPMAGRILERREEIGVWTCQPARRMVEYRHREVYVGNTE